jgi:PAS domain-containing protein
LTHVHWATLIDGLLEAVWVVDPKTRCLLAANPAACHLLQRERHALLGASVLDLTSTPEDQLFWQTLDMQHFSELHSHTQLQRSDGHW